MHSMRSVNRVVTGAQITASVIALALVGLTLVGCSGDDTGSIGRVPTAVRADPVVPASAPTTTTGPTTTGPTTTGPTTTGPGTTGPRSAPETRFGVDAYRGLGVWVDVFDWASAYTSNPIGTADVDAMAAQGAQTLYIQTNRYDHPHVELEPERLNTLIARAHSHEMRVVAWYLPTFVNPEIDLARLVAASELDVDGLAVDIESTEVADVAERNRRLVDLSTRLRAALPEETLGAIVVEPVLMEDVNPNFWPGYPWAELAPIYDVWLPMAYWTNRVGPWRSAYDYIATNVARVRERIGQPDALVHAVGGVGDDTTVTDLDAMLAAVAATEPIGASIYDYRTTKPEHWDVLRQFRR